MIFASVRQVGSTWYYIARTQGRAHEDAQDVGLMQAELYLSDLGIVGPAAETYLEGARRAMGGVMQGQTQN